MRRLFSLAIAVSLLALCASCTKSRLHGKRCYPVKGQVLFNDSPVAGALVVFEPATKSDPHWPSATGTTDANGKFTLTTYRDKDGAPAGEYNVGILDNAGGFKRLPLKKKAAPDPLKGRFSDPRTSNIHARVEEKTNNLEPFNLK
jgi:hypothetical protein